MNRINKTLTRENNVYDSLVNRNRKYESESGDLPVLY